MLGCTVPNYYKDIACQNDPEVLYFISVGVELCCLSHAKNLWLTEWACEWLSLGNDCNITVDML
jgi:hypothetical protein